MQKAKLRIPAGGGRARVVNGHTRLEPDLRLLLKRLKLTLPVQPSPEFTAP